MRRIRLGSKRRFYLAVVQVGQAIGREVANLLKDFALIEAQGYTDGSGSTEWSILITVDTARSLRDIQNAVWDKYPHIYCKVHKPTDEELGA